MLFCSARPLASTLGLTIALLGLLGPLDLAPRAEAQNGSPDTTEAKIAQATDFSIPSAPAFALLDVSPANVHTPAYPRDFKVDWIVNDDQLASNIAIQAAPIWLFGFENVSATEYRALNPVIQQLSSFELSVATTQQATDRFLAAAAKLNLYNAADPLADASYTTALSNALSFSATQDAIQNRFEGIDFEADMSESYTEKQKEAITALVDSANKFGSFKPGTVSEYKNLSSEKRKELDSVVNRLTQLHERLQDISTTIEQRVKTLKRQYEREHWNATRLDVAGGHVRQYNSPQLDSLSLASEGWGGWIIGATGVGTETDRFLLTGMARAITADTGSDDNQARYFVGVNLRYRYGSSLNNAFVEYIRRFGNRPNRHEIAYGGSLDLTERLNVQFGLRTAYDDDLDLRDLRPTIKLNGKATHLLGAL